MGTTTKYPHMVVYAKLNHTKIFTHPLCKLNERMVREMRAERISGMLYGTIAKKRGLAKVTVQNAVRGITWGHITEPPACSAKWSTR